MRKRTEKTRRAGKMAVVCTAAALVGAAPMLAEGASPKSTTFTVSLTIQAD